MLHREAVSTEILEILKELQEKQCLEDIDLADWPVMLKDPDLQWSAYKTGLQTK